MLCAGKDYFSFWVGGVKFVAANSCIFYDDKDTAKEAEARRRGPCWHGQLGSYLAC